MFNFTQPSNNDQATYNNQGSPSLEFFKFLNSFTNTQAGDIITYQNQFKKKTKRKSKATGWTFQSGTKPRKKLPEKTSLTGEYEKTRKRTKTKTPPQHLYDFTHTVKTLHHVLINGTPKFSSGDTTFGMRDSPHTPHSTTYDFLFEKLY